MKYLKKIFEDSSNIDTLSEELINELKDIFQEIKDEFIEELSNGNMSSNFVDQNIRQYNSETLNRSFRIFKTGRSTDYLYFQIKINYGNLLYNSYSDHFKGSNLENISKYSLRLSLFWNMINESINRIKDAGDFKFDDGHTRSLVNENQFENELKINIAYSIPDNLKGYKIDDVSGTM